MFPSVSFWKSHIVRFSIHILSDRDDNLALYSFFFVLPYRLDLFHDLGMYWCMGFSFQAAILPDYHWSSAVGCITLLFPFHLSPPFPTVFLGLGAEGTRDGAPRASCPLRIVTVGAAQQAPDDKREETASPPPAPHCCFAHCCIFYCSYWFSYHFSNCIRRQKHKLTLLTLYNVHVTFMQYLYLIFVYSC